MDKLDWPSISKEVGWDKTKVGWPTQGQVEELCERVHSLEREAFVTLLRYHRFLESPHTEEQHRITGKIMGVLFPAKRMYCE